MTFITLGSQKFQFNRLLEEVDKLVEANIINEKVVAQIGASTYISQHYSYQNFYAREAFQNEIDSTDIVLTHGGTGAIIGAVKKKKSYCCS